MEVIYSLDSTDSSAIAAVKSLPSEQLLEDILFIDSDFKIVSKSITLLESSKVQLSQALNILDKVSQTVIQNNNSLISEKVKCGGTASVSLVFDFKVKHWILYKCQKGDSAHVQRTSDLVHKRTRIRDYRISSWRLQIGHSAGFHFFNIGENERHSISYSLINRGLFHHLVLETEVMQQHCFQNSCSRPDWRVGTALAFYVQDIFRSRRMSSSAYGKGRLFRNRSWVPSLPQYLCQDSSLKSTSKGASAFWKSRWNGSCAAWSPWRCELGAGGVEGPHWVRGHMRPVGWYTIIRPINSGCTIGFSMADVPRGRPKPPVATVT
ncbi:hypothetical protein ANN_02164 [Periplaneta americana]|uniref:Uncharacterized protein n=1 Tax=Periplaneta americana TaxID=6978 RepID=A0ABQ8TVM5_PERAM|nr:hypothetical protein ANN_02164 [Periplaneta americana]